MPSATFVIRPAVKLVARLATGAFVALSRPQRFNALVACARALESAFARANLGRWHRSHLTSSAADTALFACCEVLDRRRILYDPKLRVVGEDVLQAALEQERGVILLTVHGLLSNLLIRYFDVECGLAPTMVAMSDETSFVSGTGRRPDVLKPSPTFLVRLRNCLRRREVVFTMVDRAPDHPRALRFDTAHGPITITDSMLRMALRLDAPVVFATCHLHDDAVVVRLEEVNARPRDLAGLTAALVALIEADMGRVRRDR